MKPIILLVAATFILSPSLLPAGDVQVRVGDVEDRRTTGKFFAGLDVELKLTGDTLADVASMRTVILSATDETGRSLLKDEEKAVFQEMTPSRGGASTIHLKLANPARKAATVKEIKGELQLFVPKRDPQANVTVPNLVAHSGQPITNAVLKAAGIEVMPLTKADFDARKARATEQKKNPNAEKGLAGAFEQAFGELFSGFMSASENSIVLLVRDPAQKLVSVEWENNSGAKVRSRGRSSSKRNNEETRIYDFEKRPDRMTLQILTAKSLVSVPLNLTDIPLP